MAFAYSDTWFLEAIKFSENGESATLTDIRQAKFRSFTWESNNRIIHAAMSPQDLPAQF